MSILKKELVNLCSTEFEAVAEDVYQTMREEVPVASGNLKSHIVKEKHGENRYLIGVDETPDMRTETGGKSYAEFVVKGTKPHEIAPRFAEALAIPVDTFTEPVKQTQYVRNGRFLTRKPVQHPGAKPNDFIQRTFDKVFKEK